MKEIDFTENETMEMLGKQDCILSGSEESKAIYAVLQAFELDKNDIAILSKSDIIVLCNNIYLLGREHGRVDNGTRKANGRNI